MRCFALLLRRAADDLRRENVIARNDVGQQRVEGIVDSIASQLETAGRCDEKA